MYLLIYQQQKPVSIIPKFPAADISEISSKFTADRSRLPTLFIATPYNKFSSPWTTPSPSPPVFSRLKLLAKESLTVLSQQLSTPKLTQVDFKVGIFQLYRHDNSQFSLVPSHPCVILIHVGVWVWNPNYSQEI